MEWQEFFEDHILDRGYEYYLEGKVRDIGIKKDCISAVVSGSENYQVQIKFDGDAIDPDMFCSCPYAEGGYRCKHMAAVLFEAEELLLPDGKSTDPDSDAQLQKPVSKMMTSVSELVQSADEIIVRSFLEKVLNGNEELRLQFETLLKPAISKEDAEKYIQLLDKRLARYGDRYGFLDWHEADPFCNEISEFLSEHIGDLMERRAYIAAFELAAHAFLKAAETEMDDSSGCQGDLADYISSIWDDLYESSDELSREHMFSWCEKHLDGSVIDYMEEYIESFYRAHFDGRDYLLRKLRNTDVRLGKYAGQDKKSGFNYTLSNLVRYRLELMQELGFGQDAISAFTDEYWQLSEVRKWVAAQREKEGDTDAAIRIYEQSLSMDCDWPGLVKDHAVKLKELYKAAGREYDYRSMLWDLELKYQPGSLDIYREMKAYYSQEDWAVLRERIYDELPKYANRAALFCEEGLYDRLLNACLSVPSISVLREYKKELLKEYPKEVLDKYVQTIEEMAKRTGTRRHYQELVALLREIEKMPGGDKEVSMITDRWRELYRGRPAMMDELSRL